MEMLAEKNHYITTHFINFISFLLLLCFDTDGLGEKHSSTLINNTSAVQISKIRPDQI